MDLNSPEFIDVRDTPEGSDTYQLIEMTIGPVSHLLACERTVRLKGKLPADVSMFHPSLRVHESDPLAQ